MLDAVMQVDPVTLRRRLQEAGSGYRHHLPDDQLLQALDAVLDLAGPGRGTGFRSGQAALMAHATLRPPRHQVLAVLRAHDPAANAARQEHTLRRCAYNITNAMDLWRFDCESQCAKLLAALHHALRTRNTVPCMRACMIATCINANPGSVPCNCG
jgi:hypothetical protein